jgi:hypothetical protein
MLKDEDIEKARFAVDSIICAADLKDIPALVACAQQHPDDRRLVAGIEITISDLLGPDSLPSSDLGEWLTSNASRLKRKKYAKIWEKRVAGALWATRWESKAGEARESVCAFYQYFGALIRSNDAAQTVPALTRLIAKVDPAKDHPAILPDMLKALQTYAGPVDVPKVDDVAGQRKAQEAVAAWWNANKSKKPVYWLLDSLARRGKQTGNPADVRGTASALLSVLSDGTPAERYAAGRILAYTLPDGDSIVLDRQALLYGERHSGDWQRVQDYLIKRVECRAYHWYLFECQDYTWNAEAGRYERSAAVPGVQRHGSEKGSEKAPVKIGKE